ncbi:MAG: ATP synthase subunit I [Propylenella sp.]
MNGAIVAAGAGLAGALVGAAHAGMLYRSVTLLAGERQASLVVAWNVGRFAVVIASFWVIAQAGAAPLIAAAAGFTVAQLAARQLFGRA